MTDTLCKLVLVSPAEVAEDIVEALLEATPPFPGFTAFNADGHGHDFAASSARERVRGRIARRCFWMVLKRQEADRVLATLRAHTRNPHVTYWIEPVIEFGHLSS